MVVIELRTILGLDPRSSSRPLWYRKDNMRNDSLYFVATSFVFFKFQRGYRVRVRFTVVLVSRMIEGLVQSKFVYNVRLRVLFVQPVC